MQFNSISFLFYFLPLFLAVYYIIPQKARNAVLAVGSMVFYVAMDYDKLWWLGLLLAVTAVTWLIGKRLEEKGSRWLLAVSLSLLACLLVFFKCWDGGAHLPGGMSFYLFQVSAYLVDVYRKKLTAQKNLITYSAQVLMFPKLLSGPIVAPKKLQDQMEDPCNCGIPFRRGLQELILGLGLKVLLADRLGGLWSQAGIAGYENISTPFAWMALIAYAMRLYFDFYGYSLMAVGLGHMLGFHLPMNFLQPYSARSVSEFYRRWHATLGAWFREYVYIPLGGNRRGMARTLLNMAAVWLLTALWHGIGGNYLIWGGFIFLLVANERLWLGEYLKRSRIWCHGYVVFVILLSWVPFAVGDWTQLVVFVGKLFGFSAKAINSMDFVTWVKDYWGLLLAGILFATPLPKKLWQCVQNSPWADVLLFVLFWAVVYFICTASQDPFMYFQY